MRIPFIFQDGVAELFLIFLSLSSEESQRKCFIETMC